MQSVTSLDFNAGAGLIPHVGPGFALDQNGSDLFVCFKACVSSVRALWV